MTGYFPIPSFVAPLTAAGQPFRSRPAFRAHLQGAADVKIGWEDVWIGAAVTALLFTAGKYLISLYLGDEQRRLQLRRGWRADSDPGLGLLFDHDFSARGGIYQGLRQSLRFRDLPTRNACFVSEAMRADQGLAREESEASAAPPNEGRRAAYEPCPALGRNVGLWNLRSCLPRLLRLRQRECGLRTGDRRSIRRNPARFSANSGERNSAAHPGDARGLAIIRVLKIGFGVSGKGGEGVVVARTAHGWSAPSFIGLGGAGWGLQIGAQVSDFIFVLNNDAAVRAFSATAM